MNEHQPHDSQPTPAAQPAPVAARGVSQSRRSLLRAGAIGAPALVALKATPVMACNCKQPSGFSVSGNLSRTGTKNCVDGATKPSGWKTTKCSSSNPYNYSGTTISKNNYFTSLTGTGSRTFQTNTAYTNQKLDAVLGRGDSDPQALIVAVYLDAVITGGANFPSKEKIIDMWNQAIIGSSGYQPTTTSSTRWYRDDVIKYLMYLTKQVV